jgi:diguanylate cyclase (GGDEF)-like protein/PAS domain S-box-containing protein
MVLATALMAPGVEFFLAPDGHFHSFGSSLGWERWIVALHLVSDLLIGLSYVAISATLIVLARRARQDIPFLWTFIAFGAFIIACGFTHFMAALTVWVPVYWAAAGIKVLTAVASVTTALAIPPLVPQVLALIQATKRSHVQALDVQAMHKALTESEARLRAFIDTAAIGVAVRDISGHYVVTNAAFAQLTGYSARDLEEMTPADLTLPDDLAVQHELEQQLLAGSRDSYYLEKRYFQPEGRLLWVAITVSVVRDEYGRPQHFMQIVEDIDARKRAEAALRDSQARFTSAFEYAPIGMALVDRTGRWLQVNPALCSIVGYSSDELLRLSFQDITHPEDLEADLTLLEQLLAGELQTYSIEKRYVRKDGVLVWVLLAVSLVRTPAGDPLYCVSQVEDITERKRVEQALQDIIAERSATLEVVEHRALHDPLTDLPNRSLLYDRLQQATRAAQRGRSRFALLLLDLDRFKQVNDTLGHHIGDELLQVLATRLTSSLRRSDTVARLGGDEFAVLLPETEPEAAAQVGSSLLAAIEEPVVLHSHRLSVSASIGLAIFPDHGDSAELLMQRADVAMYGAKQSGVGVAAYSPSHDLNSQSRLTLAAELRDALENGHLELHYQPKIEAATGGVAGVEALIRWRHPSRGLIPPGDFIPVAEQAGFLRSMSQWVLQTATEQARAWRDAGYALPVAVNLSGVNLRDMRVVQTVDDALTAAGLAPDYLGIEIAETAVMESPEIAREIVLALSSRGITIAIDDFGVGFSSLNYLARLPVHEIKIDRSFVLTMHENDRQAVIVQSIIDLGHAMGLRVVGEGIESEEVAQRLRDAGCNLLQGYLYARPLPADRVIPWVRVRTGTDGASPLLASL